MTHIAVFLVQSALFIGIMSFVQSVFATDIAINEFMAVPGTGKQEWVELYNASDSADYLTSYYIDDDTSFESDVGSSPKKLLANLNTSDVHFPYMLLTSSMFNNDGDTVALFDQAGKLIDQFTYYDNPGTDVSIGRYPDGSGSFLSLASVTMGSANAAPVPTATPTLPATPTPTPTPTPTLTPTATVRPTQTPTPTITSAISLRIRPTIMPATSEAHSLGATNEQKTSSSSAQEAGPSPLPYVYALLSVGIGSAFISLTYIFKKREDLVPPEGS